MFKKFLLGLMTCGRLQLVFIYIVALSFTALSGLAVAEEKYSSLSPKEAILAADLCQTTRDDRTLAIWVNNKTHYTVEIVFFQGKDESNNVPDGYVADTGTYVGGTMVNGPGLITTDPCYAGGFKRPVQATVLKGSVTVIDDDGKKSILHFEDISTGDLTRYWESNGWDIVYTKDNDKKSPPISKSKRLKQKKH